MRLKFDAQLNNPKGIISTLEKKDREK